jgi:hypothetical protein
LREPWEMAVLKWPTSLPDELLGRRRREDPRTGSLRSCSCAISRPQNRSTWCTPSMDGRRAFRPRVRSCHPGTWGCRPAVVHLPPQRRRQHGRHAPRSIRESREATETVPCTGECTYVFDNHFRDRKPATSYSCVDPRIVHVCSVRGHRMLELERNRFCWLRAKRSTR